MIHPLQRLCVLVLCLWLSACAVVNISDSGKTALSRNARWVMLPVLNHTETPQAGLRAETILVPLLHQQGLEKLATYPASMGRESLLLGNEQASQEEARRWAKEQGFRYAVTGSVDEWRYKVGVDGEPAVGMNLLVWDLNSDKIVWSAVGGKSGYSREAVSAVAQKLARDLLRRLPLVDSSSETNQ